MARLYLVRHAKAGERRLWEGDDIDRPLSKKGWKQAEHLAARLAKQGATSLVSSPYVRCVQTLEPAGRRLDVPVTVDARLREDEPVGPVLELLGDAADGAVLCSHGDIIPDAIEVLRRQGAALRSPADWRKATTWVLKRNRHGAIVQVICWPPPRL